MTFDYKIVQNKILSLAIRLYSAYYIYCPKSIDIINILGHFLVCSIQNYKHLSYKMNDNFILFSLIKY